MSNAAQAAIAAALAKAAEQNDQRVATAGGGDYEQPKAGLSIVTLIGYIELGIQKHEIPNKPPYDSNDVSLIFELNGGVNKGEVVEGKLVCKRLTVTEKLSTNEKANFFKVFNQLNYDGQATHMTQLLGKHFLGTVYVDKGKDGKEYATFKGPSGYNFTAPVVIKGDPLDPENQTKVPVPAPARAETEDKVFLWDYACKEMWDLIFIDGEYEAVPAKDGKPARPARSKNRFQDTIRKAKNFATSPIKAILGEEALDLADSPLSGVVDQPDEQAVADAASTQVQGAAASDAASDDPLAGL
jgi:hypothetical protein